MRRLALFLVLVSALLLGPAATPSWAEVAQSGDVRIGFNAELAPRALPRSDRAPVSVVLDGTIKPVRGELPPRLDRIKIEFNRHGRLDPNAVPICPIRSIQPSTTAAARRICPHSIVGEGHFTAKILLPAQSPFPSRGKVVAFNGSYRGKPAVLAHIYGTRPGPTSLTLPFVFGRSRGDFGVTLTASLPRVASSSAYVTGLSVRLGGGAGGHGRPYLSAACPAPAGLGSVIFPLVRASFAFASAPTLRTTLLRSCEVRR